MPPLEATGGAQAIVAALFASPEIEAGMPFLRDLKSLIHDAVDATTELVREGHESTARSVRRVTDPIPGISAPVKAVDRVRDLSTRGVLGTIRGVNRVVELASDATLDALSPAHGASPPVPLRSDALGTRRWIEDAAQGMLNGVLGDHLARTGNGLDLGLSLRVGDASTTGKLVVLVHGLSTTEWSWTLDAAARLGDPARNYGSLLQEELGYTPVWVRYNTGLPVHDNGIRLSEALERLVLAWPVPVEEIVLLGHSMGGLVSRVAASEGHQGRSAWLSHLRRVICLGSPHQGAPLEQLGAVATSVLGAIDLPSTRVGAAFLSGRSGGIQSLGKGLPSVQEGGPVLVPDVAYAFAAGTLSKDPSGPLGTLFGDGLVLPQSANDPRHPVRTEQFGGIAHAQLQVDRRVYAWIRELCSEPSS